MDFRFLGLRQRNLSPLSLFGTRYYHRMRYHTSTSEDTPRAAYLLPLQTHVRPQHSCLSNHVEMERRISMIFLT